MMRPSRQPIVLPNSAHCVPSKRISCIREEIGRAGVDLDPSSSIGSRFTGMPGWGGSDEENWKLVLFLRHLPNLTPEEMMEDVKGGG